MVACEFNSFSFVHLLICKISDREFRNINSQYPKEKENL